MTISTTNVTLSAIKTEFGGPDYALSSYYRTAGYVPTDQPDQGYGLIPTSGTISLSSFRGATIRTVATTTPFGSTSSGGTWSIYSQTGTDSEGNPTYGTITGWGYPLIANTHWVGSETVTLGGIYSGTTTTADVNNSPTFTITNPNKGRTVQFAINLKFFVSTHQAMRFMLYRSNGTLIAASPSSTTYSDFNRLNGVGAGVAGNGNLSTDGYWQVYLTGYDNIPGNTTYTYYARIESAWNGDYNYGAGYPSGLLYAQAVQNALV